MKEAEPTLIVLPNRRLIEESELARFMAENGVSIINKVGIGQATQMAFRKVIKNLKKSPDQRAVADGDKICASISAGSIVAKVYRDELMRKLHLKYPNYGLDKGYGTKFHQEAIRKYGLSKIHRTSFNLQKSL